jgi:intracellular protein transport protein USO1
MPVPESNGEEWDRLEPASALDALVELVLHGEYNGLHNDKRVKEGLELRGAAVAVFEVSRCQIFVHLFMILNELQNFIRTEEIRQAIVQAMLPAQGAFRIIFPPSSAHHQFS